MAHSTGDKHGGAGALTRQGVFGCYSSTLGSDQLAARQRLMLDAWNTRTQTRVESAAGATVGTTGTLCPLADGGFVIVCGQPYFRDSDLARAAHKQGVAAVLADRYPEQGRAILQHLYGAFSCAVVDTRNNNVLLAIDRLGQHSMYYSVGDDTLVFGDAAGVVLAGVQDGRALLNQGIFNYLYFHMIPAPGTVYRGLKKLPAAHCLEFQDGRHRTSPYWLPSFSESLHFGTMNELSERLRSDLRSAVKRDLESAGKVGSFLSGGLDSSTVTGVLAEASERQAPAFAIGFSAEGYDEMAYARITARHFGVSLNEYYVTPEDVVTALPLVATSYDEPFGNSSALPAYFCAKVASEAGIDTLLAGDGGDELFGGNERYVRQRVFERYALVPRFLRRGLLEPVVASLPQGLPLVAKAGSYIEQANTPLPDRLQSYNFLHRHAPAEIFTAEFLSEVDSNLPLEQLRSFYQRPEQGSDLNRLLYLDWQITLADNDLRKVSHMCAMAGVNVRYPMLDDALVDLACDVPSSLKIKGGQLRYFYKQALSGWLPQATIEKSKQGFGLPFGVWMRTYQPLRELAYDNLLKLKSREFIRPEFIDRAIAMHQSEHAAYYGELVWLLTVFELWVQGHSLREASAGSAPVERLIAVRSPVR